MIVSMNTANSGIQALGVKSCKVVTSLKRADLDSSVELGVLAVGLGILLFPLLQTFWILIIAVGGVTHMWGMFRKHRLEKQNGEVSVWWSEALCWFCWLVLLIIAYLLFQ